MTAPPACQAAPYVDSLWVGPPGKLRRLPMPDSGLTRTLSRGATAHTLVSGGSSVTRRPTVKRGYSATWTQRLPEAADELVALYAGTRGVGPYCLLDPGWRNFLDEPTSTGGLARGANTAWTTGPSGSAATLDLTVAPPPQAALGGVVRWANPAVNASLWAGDYSVASGGLFKPGANPVPYVPGLPYAASVWVRFAAVPGAAAAVTLWLAGLSDSGWSVVNYAVGSLAISDANWHQLVAYVPTTFAWNTPWLSLDISVGSPAPGVDVLVAGAQLESRESAAGPLPWVTGLGCPRVVIPDPLGDTSTLWTRRSHTMSFLER